MFERFRPQQRDPRLHTGQRNAADTCVYGTGVCSTVGRCFALFGITVFSLHPNKKSVLPFGVKRSMKHTLLTPLGERMDVFRNKQVCDKLKTVDCFNKILRGLKMKNISEELVPEISPHILTNEQGESVGVFMNIKDYELLMERFEELCLGSLAQSIKEEGGKTKSLEKVEAELKKKRKE